jgi:hypothetical protein
VKVFEGKNDGCEVETGDIGAEASSATEVGEKLTPRNIRKQHINVQAVLESRVKIDDERMSHTGKDASLCFDVFDLTEANHLGLLEHLHCEKPGRIGWRGGCRTVLDKEDAPECTRS